MFKDYIVVQFFTPPSGRGLLIPVFYPAVRTGSSNSHFFFIIFPFFGGHLPQTSGFARPNIVVASFATQARACILSDHDIFFTKGRGGGRRGNAPGAFYPAVRTGSSNTRFFFF